MMHVDERDVFTLGVFNRSECGALLVFFRVVCVEIFCTALAGSPMNLARFVNDKYVWGGGVLTGDGGC